MAARVAKQQRWAAAEQLARGAHVLHRDADSTRLLAVCHLMQRQFAEAIGGYWSAVS